MTRPLRSSPITEPSSLLRGSPPLSGASVLSASRWEPLAPFPLASPAKFSRSVLEPDRGSRRLHPGCRSVGIRTSSELIPEEVPAPGFDIVYGNFDASAAVRLRPPLSTIPAGIIVPTFPRCSPPQLLAAAARGGLGSVPNRRTRRALLHLHYSCAPPFGPAMLVTQGTLTLVNVAGRPAAKKMPSIVS
jgi:hypothetical protein